MSALIFFAGCFVGVIVGICAMGLCAMSVLSERKDGEE